MLGTCYFGIIYCTLSTRNWEHRRYRKSFLTINQSINQTINQSINHKTYLQLATYKAYRTNQYQLFNHRKTNLENNLQLMQFQLCISFSNISRKGDNFISSAMIFHNRLPLKDMEFSPYLWELLEGSLHNSLVRILYYTSFLRRIPTYTMGSHIYISTNSKETWLSA